MDTQKKKAIVLQLFGSLGAITGFLSERIKNAICYWSHAVKGGTVLVDLSEVNSIDSLGMRALLETARMGNVEFCNPPSRTIAMFRSAKLNKESAVYSSVAEAVEKLNLEISRTLSEEGERRNFPRTEICAPTKFKIRSGNESIVFRGVITNISLAGVLIEYVDDCVGGRDFVLYRGMPIEDLELSSLKSGLTFNGTLTRLSDDHCQIGLGIRFRELTEQVKKPLAEYINNAGEVHLQPHG
jgi:anti-anti-sigma regulatory factor